MSRTVPALALRRAVVPRRGMTRGYATKQPSVTAQFYKQFTRPMAKALLLAVFTYQLTYWSWVKLETDEIRAERDTEIATLEAKVDAYGKSKSEDKAAKSS
ncbi:Fc.00g053280.m01.CDS01 [Cosmosporella sp. VM-42]